MARRAALVPPPGVGFESPIRIITLLARIRLLVHEGERGYRTAAAR
jgi:hypothetical protein